LSGRSRFTRALEGDDLAFAPIVWERLPELVHQERADWWQDPAAGRRLISEVAALALADAMFVFVAAEAVRCAVGAGEVGDEALDSLARSHASAQGIELVACLRDVSQYAVIAALPAPARLQHEMSGKEIETAEDAFTDLVSSYLQAGADAIAVTGHDVQEVRAGLSRAARLGKLFSLPVLGICPDADAISAWDEHGLAFGVVPDTREWPAIDRGLVITASDVSTRWNAAQLRLVGSARP